MFDKLKEILGSEVCEIIKDTMPTVFSHLHLEGAPLFFLTILMDMFDHHGKPIEDLKNEIMSDPGWAEWKFKKLNSKYENLIDKNILKGFSNNECSASKTDISTIDN